MTELEDRCNRDTRATAQTVCDRRFCENVNGDGSCCTICEEPATAPSPPVLRMYCNRVVPVGALLSQRVTAPVREEFKTPMSVTLTVFNEEKET